jgi:hypothetical protein
MNRRIVTRLLLVVWWIGLLLIFAKTEVDLVYTGF